MAHFTDNQGRDWHFCLTTMAARWIGAELDFPLAEMLDPATSTEPIRELVASPDLAGLIVWLLVEDNAEVFDVTSEEFFGGMDEQAESRALVAILQAVRARNLSRAKA